ncbi:MAG TPA: TonB family protein [Thermoanaerobaculia bacterium]|nr:TonB family protein [Thermoanaerobaculia bacterium]
MSNVCPRCEAVLDDSVVRCPHCGTSVELKRGVPKKTRFQLGELIDGRYQVVDILPSGGMGDVYKVRHVHLNDLRIIKVLRSELTNDENGKKRFLREAKIAASISHPNLAGLHDFSALSDGSFYMVGEYVDGMTIADHILAGGRFEIAHVLTIAEQVLKAMSALHHRGIVHRDISPDNLMLTKNAAGTSVIKVIDLGIAKSVDSASEGLTSAGFFIGKARYASPEQLRCAFDEQVDSRTDLYSLGIVLYEMITGRDPYAGSTPAQYVIKKVTQEVRRINEPGKQRLVPDEIERFVLTLLKANRDERFQTADQALAEIVRLQQNFPELANQTLSTVTQTRPMPKEALQESPPTPPRKRPITEEVDLRAFIPKEESAPATVVAEEAAQVSPGGTEVIPMADFARELYAQQHGGATGTPETGAPMNAPLAPPPVAFFGDEAGTVVDYMAPPELEPEPSTEAFTLANFVPPGTTPDSTDVLPKLDKAAMDALQKQNQPEFLQGSRPPSLSQEATIVTPLMSGSAQSLLSQLPNAQMDPSLAPTDVGGEIPFDPSINPNARVSRRNSSPAPSTPLGFVPLPNEPKPATEPPPLRPTYAAQSRQATPVPPPAAGANPRAGTSLPPPAKKSNAILWIVVVGFLLALVAAGIFAYRILAARLLKPAAENEATTSSAPSTQVAKVDTAPAPQIASQPPPTETVPPTATTTAAATQTDTALTSSTASVDTATTETTPPTTQSVAPVPVKPPTTESPKKPATPRKKKERVVAPAVAPKEPPQPVVPQVKEGDLVESGEGVVDAQIRQKAPLKLGLRTRLSRAKGAVKVYAMVGISGKVEQVRVLSSSGNDQIDRAAEAAAIASTFTPATKNGVRVRMWRTIEYEVGRQ